MKIKIEEAKGIDIVNVTRRSPMPDGASALSEFLNRSAFSWTGSVNGQVACVWGLIAPTMLSDRAYLWLLTTDLVEEHKFLFVRYSQRCVEEMLRLYPVIHGNVDTRHPGAVQWLRWLGAEFLEPVGLGVPFVIRAK